MTIDCVYDPLYRITEADYSTGDYYRYTYDAAANRLIDVDGVPYTWDNNGNASIAKHSARRLLNGGLNTYTGVYPEPAEGIPPTD